MWYEDKVEQLQKDFKNLGKRESFKALKWMAEVMDVEIEIRDNRISELEFKLKLLIDKEGVS